MPDIEQKSSTELSMWKHNRIQQLEAELKAEHDRRAELEEEVARLKEVLKHIDSELFKLQGQMIPSKEASCTLVDLRTFVSCFRERGNGE